MTARQPPLSGVVARGLARGALYGAVLGALTGAAITAWSMVQPVPAGTFDEPFLLQPVLVVTVIAACVGATLGVLSAAAAMAVLAVADRRGRRRSWTASVLAASASALTTTAVPAALWFGEARGPAGVSADALIAVAGPLLAAGAVSAAVALRCVRHLVRP